MWQDAGMTLTDEQNAITGTAPSLGSAKAFFRQSGLMRVRACPHNRHQLLKKRVEEHRYKVSCVRRCKNDPDCWEVYARYDFPKFVYGVDKLRKHMAHALRMLGWRHSRNYIGAFTYRGRVIWAFQWPEEQPAKKSRRSGRGAQHATGVGTGA